MKKSFILLGSALLLVTTSNAQEAAASGETLKSKSGEAILPAAKDWSIGIDATPFFEYAGSFFNNNENNDAPTWGGYNSNNNTVVGKMFIDDKTAYRAVISINKENFSRTNEITKAVAMPAPSLYVGDKKELVTDTWKRSSNGIVLGGGIEKRRGAGKLQGFYGGEAIFSFQGATNDRFTYGNMLTQNPTGDQPNVNAGDATYSTNWTGSNLQNGSDFLTQNAGVNSARILSQKQGAGFAFGLRGFIGAEYFFMPKMSVGGEFGWGLAVERSGKSHTEFEAEGLLADGSEAAATVSETQDVNKDFSIGNTEFGLSAITNYLSPRGTLRLNFHF